jgi:lactoylglutathione lyase
MPALNFAFTKMVVADLAAAEHFYTSTLGLTRLTYIEFGEGSHALKEVILSIAGADPQVARLNLIHYPSRPTPAPGEAIFGFMVDDIEAALEAMIAAGGQIAVPLQDVPEHSLRLAFIADPEGHMVEILQAL